MTPPRRELSPTDTKEQPRVPLDGAGAFEEFSLDCEGGDELKSAISRRRLDGWKLHTAVKLEDGKTLLTFRRVISR
jgi:hypothetical protein